MWTSLGKKSVEYSESTFALHCSPLSTGDTKNVLVEISDKTVDGDSVIVEDTVVNIVLKLCEAIT